MSRLAFYTGVVAVLAVGVALVVFSQTIATRSVPTIVRAPQASATPVLEPKVSTTTATPAVPTPAAKHTAKAKIVQSTTTPKSVKATVSPQEMQMLLDNSATALRNALVNIICSVPIGSDLHSISGSGIIIDSKGIILTNAHIAQYFLFADRDVSCVIRSGSPATNKYFEISPKADWEPK